jgi:hypothetical protein
MAIIVRNGQDKWQTIEASPFVEEVQLQKLLYDSPELIPTEHEGDTASFIREAGLPGSGSTDLIGVDSHGNILVVETKLAKNQEARRKVVGQILEYAAFLWGMSFDDFDDLFLARRNKSILALISEQKNDVLVEGLRDTIRRNLASGNFQLLIAVDAMNDELERIISYFAECGGGIRLEALELELYKTGATEIIVPQRHGQNKRPTSASGGHFVSTAEMLNNCPDETSRDRLQLLVQLWTDLENPIEPGKVGASFKANINGRLHPIFWAYPENLVAAFGELINRGVAAADVNSFREVVATFGGFDKAKVMNQSQPTAKLRQLTEQEIREFVEESQRIVKRWRQPEVPQPIASST